jgi:hypothetical protein
VNRNNVQSAVSRRPLAAISLPPDLVEYDCGRNRCVQALDILDGDRDELVAAPLDLEMHSASLV